MGSRKLEARINLHASATNMYWFMIFIAVNGVVGLSFHLYALWSAGNWQGAEAAVIACCLLVFLGCIAFCERRARWLIADPTGLEIIGHSRTRLVPWKDVTIEELSMWGSAPGSRRYHLSLADGDGFIFLGDPDAMAKLPSEARFIPRKRFSLLRWLRRRAR